MKETRYFYVPDAAHLQELPSDEASHAVRVLRLGTGDELMLMDGQGCFYRAEVTVASNHHCMYAIQETMPQERPWQGHIHLAIAPTKLIDRIEWMIEKAVEIGIDEITFLDCKFSERKVVKTERLDKIAVSAMKQSRKAWKPVLHEMTSFKDFITADRGSDKYIAHCYEEVERTFLFDELKALAATEDVTILIGPEGDFSMDEVKEALAQGYHSVHLGTSRLRTETAGLAAVMMAQLSKNE
ncbi:MAG: 16S rRNA (uracil(1498)-N(3))-methyltransferase [Prevotella sp.]|nr:16S rRNA (uracil(1498)-N(3))-methyltransferase [Prevotella sp.]